MIVAWLDVADKAHKKETAVRGVFPQERTFVKAAVVSALCQERRAPSRETRASEITAFGIWKICQLCVNLDRTFGAEVRPDFRNQATAHDVPLGAARHDLMGLTDGRPKDAPLTHHAVAVANDLV